MAEVVPIELGSTNQEMTVQLDGVDFILRFLWQDRDESWYFELYDSARVPIWMGQRIATGVPLLAQCVNARRPAGELICIDTQNEDKDPGIDDFGDDPARVLLIYLSAADVAAAA